jgi:hypothetical protein
MEEWVGWAPFVAGEIGREGWNHSDQLLIDMLLVFVIIDSLVLSKE